MTKITSPGCVFKKAVLKQVISQIAKEEKKIWRLKMYVKVVPFI